MKPASILLLFILIFPLFSIAQQGRYNQHERGYRDDASSLSVFSENGEQFFLVLNGINQNNEPTSKIRVDGLPQYGNDIEILFADRRTPAIRKKLTIADPVDGKEVNMGLKIARGRDGYARLKFFKCTEIDRDYRAPQDEYCMIYGQPRRINIRDNRDYDRQLTGPVAMDAASFNDAKDAINNSSFDDTKLSTAKSIVGVNYLTTHQVIEICGLFSFENRKLEFAKFAYSRTVDPNNYFKVGNVFTFDSNKRALNDFISGKR